MARLLLLAPLLAAVSSAQVPPARIPPDFAEKQLIKSPSPEYPKPAQHGRIQGSVILEIRIDESGAASVHRLISGHPLLAPEATEAVNQWRYKPFEIDGKPAVVTTFVLVVFGNQAAYAAQARAEVTFLNDFWTAEESAEAALAAGDYAKTEQLLYQANELLLPDRDNARHMPEKSQLLTALGELRQTQKKYEEAEQYYKNALVLHQNKWDKKDSPEVATALSNLAALYAEEKRLDLANDSATQSLAIFEENFRRVGSRQSDARQAYGRGAAEEAWLLLKLAKERDDVATVKKQCSTLSEFQAFLNSADQASVASACQIGSPDQVKPQ